jgi:hypothetical protein
MTRSPTAQKFWPCTLAPAVFADLGTLEGTIVNNSIWASLGFPGVVNQTYASRRDFFFDTAQYKFPFNLKDVL